MCAAHPRNLAGTAVLQPQKFIHDSILICGLCGAKTTSYESYHWGRQLAANRSQKRSGSYSSGFTRNSEVGGSRKFGGTRTCCRHVGQVLGNGERRYFPITAEKPRYRKLCRGELFGSATWLSTTP